MCGPQSLKYSLSGRLQKQICQPLFAQQLFSTGSDFAPQGTFDSTWRRFWLLNLEEVLLACSWRTSRMLLNILQCIGVPLTPPEQRIMHPEIMRGWETLAYSSLSICETWVLNTRRNFYLKLWNYNQCNNFRKRENPHFRQSLCGDDVSYAPLTCAYENSFIPQWNFLVNMKLHLSVFHNENRP